MKSFVRGCLVLLLGVLLLCWGSEGYFIRVKRAAVTPVNPEMEFEPTEAPEYEGVPTTPAPTPTTPAPTPAPTPTTRRATTRAIEEPASEVATKNPVAGSVAQTPVTGSPGLPGPGQSQSSPGTTKSPTVGPSSSTAPVTAGSVVSTSPAGGSGAAQAPAGNPTESTVTSGSPGNQDPPANNAAGPSTTPSSARDPGVSQSGSQGQGNLSQSLAPESSTPSPVPAKRPSRGKSGKFPLRPFDPESLTGANGDILPRVPSSLKLPPRGPFSSGGLPRVKLPSRAASDPKSPSANSAASSTSPVPRTLTTTAAATTTSPVPTTTSRVPTTTSTMTTTTTTSSTMGSTVGQAGGAAERAELVRLLKGPKAPRRVAKLAKTGRLGGRLTRMEGKLRLSGAGMTDQERLEQLLETLVADGPLQDKLAQNLRAAFSPKKKKSTRTRGKAGQA